MPFKKSIAIYKNFDCGNAKFMFTYYVKTAFDSIDDYVGAIFRYNKFNNIEEYYMFKFKFRKIEFVKVYNSSEDLITFKEFDLVSNNKDLPIDIYNVIIIYNQNKIELFINHEPLLSYDKKLEIEHNDIQRGKIGFSTSGNYDIKISNIKLDKPEFKRTNNN